MKESSIKSLLILIYSLALFTATTNAHCSEWKVIPGGLKHVSASMNYLWGVNVYNQIFICARPCTGSWTSIEGGKRQVDASDEEVWGVNNADHIYKTPVDGSVAWKRIAGLLKHVSASGNGYIWGVNSTDDIFKCKKPCTGGWSQVAGKLKQIDGGQQYVYGVNSYNDVYTRPVDGSGNWRYIPGKKLKYVTASGIHEVFGVDTDDHLWRCRKPCLGNWERMAGELKQLDATVNEIVGVSKYGVIESHQLGSNY